MQKLRVLRVYKEHPVPSMTSNVATMQALLFLVLSSSSILCAVSRHGTGDYRERIVSKSARFPGLVGPRIIGGESASIEEYPFVVSLQNNGTFFGHQVEHFCGGGIVGEKWIITSAQCALSVQAKPFHVRAGTSRYYEGGDNYGVQSVAIHPAFNAINYDYDVGLVELSDRITYDNTKQPIKLPKTHSMIDDDSLVLVLGWGASRLLGPVSNELLYTTMRKINNRDCEEASDGDLLTNRMFCALSDTARPCIGDSGSPLIFQGALFGITSWSRSCEWQYPTVFTAIAEVKDWITNVTGTL
ncbi:trypsin-7-like isoform X2 [Apis dorsata]|uniref:trypsin-7-like isoform X2 n=1 Tax=Apis dorsata TaxID=7462 RepID=UPI001293C227|nr:trypsin-7-like isoform X2 [Apis dorsata]